MTDHLGNNRVVVKADGTVIQTNHYYPFGMAFAENTVAEQGRQPYKYNGKELDAMPGLSWYDYSARHKDDWRFTTVDPMAEKYYSISPYAYCGNNPLKYIDPTGMWYDDYFNRDGVYLGTDNSTSEQVRVMDQGAWDANSNGDGTISPDAGVANSSLHSQSGINSNASVKIYQHYNNTGLRLSGGDGNFLMRTEVSSVGNSVLEKKLLVNPGEAYKGSDPVSNNINDIKNTFVHENKHSTDVNDLGVARYQKLATGSAPVDVLEERAINTQVQHPTWKKTSSAYKERIYNYANSVGAIVPHLNVNVMTPKSTVPLKIK